MGPIQPGDFLAEDFKELEIFEYKKRTQPVVEALESMEISETSVGRLVASSFFILISQGFNWTWATIASSRHVFETLVSMASSLIASIQLPDPSESGLFDTPPKPRQRSYMLLDRNHT